MKSEQAFRAIYLLSLYPWCRSVRLNYSWQGYGNGW